MRLLIPIFLLSVSLNGFSQFTNLVWSDEFNGTSLDQTKWVFQNGDGCPSLCGWGNGELQTYTANNKNIKVENGLLTITAVKENIGQAAFSASKLRTLGLHAWTYGRFEARMRMPLGKGLWPAFWMLSVNNDWPMTGEIDIMEYRGDLPRETHGTLHYGAPWPNNRYDGTVYTHAQNLSSDFHIYAVEWDENNIKWFFDDILFKTETRQPNSLNPPSNGSITWPWTSDFYLIVNLAVGGGFTGNPAVNDVQLTKPTFEIDYVRVYSNSPTCPNQLSIAGRDAVQTNQSVTYSVPIFANANYNWSISGNGQLVSGQGTNSISVVWNQEENTIVNLTMDFNQGSVCQQLSAGKTVKVNQDYCDLVYVDFEQIPQISYQSGNGSILVNPQATAQNNSTKVYSYTRSLGSQYDVIFIDDLPISRGGNFENGHIVLEMDVYTTAPIGTPIQLQLASTTTWQDTWPHGRHSVYTATTTQTNTWESLQFQFSQVGAANRAQFEDDLDRIVVLVHPSSYTNGTYLIDNIRKRTLSSELCTITGTKKTQEAKINSYPNPVVSNLFLSEKSEWVLYNSHGQELERGNSISVDMSNYASGIYLLQVGQTMLKIMK